MKGKDVLVVETVTSEFRSPERSHVLILLHMIYTINAQPCLKILEFNISRGKNPLQ